MKLPDKLALQQIERRLKPIREVSQFTELKSGWIKFIRKAVGLSREQLAERAGISKSAIQHAEGRELEGRVTLATLRKIAAAMNCNLTYALVPKLPLSDTLTIQAKAKAKTLLKSTEVHMVLEDQEVDSNPEDRIEALASELLSKGDIW